MGRFIGHEPCKECGSRDNFGRYDDGGGFCFGCGHVEKPTHAPRRYERIEHDVSSTPQIPVDTATNFSQEAVQWLAQYHVSVEHAIANGLRWSDSRQQLIFLLEDGCWQSRNFDVNQAKKRKYFTAGNVNDSIKIYLRDHNGGKRSNPIGSTGRRGDGNCDIDSSECLQRLVIVEDCLSALRIASQCDAMPVLGSHVATQKLVRLARLYSSLVIWLDHDKLTEAKALAAKGKMLGLSTSVIYTELDPKCYTDNEIKEYLNG